MTGSTTEVAPCANISPGWPCPWARCRAASGRARCGARRYRGGGGGGDPVVGGGGGGVGSQWLLAPPTCRCGSAPGSLYLNPLPVHPPPRPCGSLDLLVLGPGWHGTGQSLRYGNSTLCICVGAAVGPRRG